MTSMRQQQHATDGYSPQILRISRGQMTEIIDITQYLIPDASSDDVLAFSKSVRNDIDLVRFPSMLRHQIKSQYAQAVLYQCFTYVHPYRYHAHRLAVAKLSLDFASMTRHIGDPTHFSADEMTDEMNRSKIHVFGSLAVVLNLGFRMCRCITALRKIDSNEIRSPNEIERTVMRKWSALIAKAEDVERSFLRARNYWEHIYDEVVSSSAGHDRDASLLASEDTIVFTDKKGNCRFELHTESLNRPIRLFVDSYTLIVEADK